MSLRTGLTLRYGLALLSIALIVTATHAVRERHRATRYADGETINLSGIQRMLTQRVALLAVELTAETQVGRAARLAASLEEAVHRLGANQDTLAGQPFEGGAERVAATRPETLYDDRRRIRERVRRLVDTGTALLARHESGGLPAVHASGLADRIVSLALDGRLLEDLDDVVASYERGYALGMRDARRLEAALLWATLAALLLAAWTIFRPMVRSATGAVVALERANAELREFAYRLSHDLRAPVASARGLTALIEDSLAAKDLDEAHEVTVLLDDSLSRLDGLIGDLSDVVRARDLDVVPEAVDVGELVDDVLGSLAHASGFDDVRIDVRVELDRPILVKRLHLRSALENIVSNAIKYADRKEPEPRLELRIDRRRGRVRIDVRDNGLGIPPSCRDRVFSMFSRFHPGAAPGSGLGLYLVLLSVQAIGGTIRYEPLPDGSRFALAFEEAAVPAP